MPRRTIHLSESVDELIRRMARPGESFSATVARLIEAGVRSTRGRRPPSYVATGEGPDDLAGLAERYLREGQFAEGSMAPKVEAALRFLSRGGRRCCITSSRWAVAAVAGSHGTRIVAPVLEGRAASPRAPAAAVTAGQ